MRLWAGILCRIALLGSFATAGFSQSVSATLTGIIRDPDGAVVPGATVAARNVATNAVDSVVSHASGVYRLVNLVPGLYTLEVQASGFRAATVRPQRISTGESLRVDVALEIGPVTASVTVDAAALEVNTEDAQLGKTQRSIADLPLLSAASGRNVVLLASTQPGVLVSDPTWFGTLSANGQRFRSTNFLLDGGDSNDQVFNKADAVPQISPNALAEFRLITGPIKAEYGRNSGAVVAVTTKSGGNTFHGQASEILRNTKLNAVPFFQKSAGGGTRERFANGLPRKPQWNGNDFDANLGGPVQREKSFFFVSYLGFRRRQGLARAATVPSDVQRAAIEAGGTPEARALLALVPRATTGNILFSAPSDSLRRDQGVVKFDHYFSDANRFAATWFIEDQDLNAPFGLGGRIPGFGYNDRIRWNNVVLRDSHSFSPTLFHELRAAFHRQAATTGDMHNRTPLGSLGLRGIVPAEAAAEGPPLVRVLGFDVFGNGDAGPLTSNRNNSQILDNVSWTRGRHSLKFGGEVRTFANNIRAAILTNGVIIIDGTGTTGRVPLVTRVLGLPAALNDFANGFASMVSQFPPVLVGARSRSLNLFLQDDWKIHRRLTVNLGLRWEYNTPDTELGDQLLAFRSGVQSVVFPDAPTGMVYPGDPGVTRSTFQRDLNNFGPRFGVAWDVLGSGRLSLRGGYALLYDVLSNDLGSAFIRAAPFRINPGVRDAAYADPWRTSLVSPIPPPFPYRAPAPGERFDFTRIAPIPLSVLDADFATPYAQQWSLQVQQQLRKHWVMEAAYAASVGRRLLNHRQVNPAVPGPGATMANTDARRIVNVGHPDRARFNGTPFGDIINYLTDSNSSYHSLQLNVTRRFADGFQTTHAYTWSHAIDDESDRAGFVTLLGTSRIDSSQNDRGNSAHDVRHRYVFSFVYEFPFARRRRGGLGRLLGGWGVSGLTTFQTGNVFNIIEPQDRCLCASGGQRPDFLGGEVRYFDPRSTTAVPGRPNSWFDGTGGGSPTGALNPYFRRVGSGASAALGAGRFGSLGRNVFHGPGINNWDLAAFKRTPLAEGHMLEFRADFLNLLNHAQFLNPNPNIQMATFGQITTTRDPRIIQVSLRYGF